MTVETSRLPPESIGEKISFAPSAQQQLLVQVRLIVQSMVQTISTLNASGAARSPSGSAMEILTIVIRVIG